VGKSGDCSLRVLGDGSLWNSPGGGPLVAQSLKEHPVTLPLGSLNGFYASHDNGAYAFFLSDIPLAALLDGSATDGIFLHVDLHWIPKPGKTPFDITATNATIRLVIVANGEIGIYGGAGFARPQGKPKSEKGSGDAEAIFEWGLSFRQSSLTLLDHSDGFRDLLSPCEISGALRATLNPTKSHRMQVAASQFVTNMLGKTRFVRR